MLTIHPIRAFKDNYIWMVINNKIKEVIIVDPGDTELVLKFLRENNLRLKAILLTHKHPDHIGGVAKLCEEYKNISVYSHQKENIKHTTDFVSQENIFNIENFPLQFHIIEIPGHTLGHIAFYSAPYLFCGDTLFSAGCGKIFEGTAPQMFASLKKLFSLPNETQIYCGHEYTINNLKFALTVEPDNIDMQNHLKECEKLRAERKPTLPSTILLEKKINPFLRCYLKNVVSAVEHYAEKKLPTETLVFEAMRNWKNNF
ncbi:MAG TPA: hydroxyacylglutathione hydrolase [Coxiellaceae bacterium]|nr:MAG: hydroxyacylglutathione hydrolase [Gammaproteobacteria bacterium RIFCSPHIGHO2_12_FULL_36_30]HLB56784.1 hydroxyacylglutathione hydrolase [Coxiellaceae bacterium]